MHSHEPHNNVVEVALRMGRGLSTLTYLRPKSSAKDVIFLGKRVVVELGKRQVHGVVTREGGFPVPVGISLKEVLFATDNAPILTKDQLKLAHFVADYYEAPFFDCLKLCLPKLNQSTDAKAFFASQSLLEKLKLDHGHESKSLRITRSKLVEYAYSEAQISALLASEELTIEEKFVKPSRRAARVEEKTLTDEQGAAVRAILEGQNTAFLLEGITGSGKTEVYLAAAKSVLEKGQSVLFIVPEIGLTPHLFERIHSVLGEEPALVHSNIGTTLRDHVFGKIREGRSRVIIGARSALFSPVQNIGLIVVDEEHDGGLKQSESPRYHARDVALWLAKSTGARIILGSATPSLESLHNVEKGLLTHLKLTKRARATSMLPDVQIVDIRERRAHAITKAKDKPASEGSGLCILSGPLKEAMEATLAKKEQVILFLNRLGYASQLICEDCGNILKCPDCSITLTYHKKLNLLRCHQCSYTEVFKTQCPECPNGTLIPLGLGTERVEKELQLSFPNAQIARFDRESLSTNKKLEDTLRNFRSGEIDILIGTQMIAKGHDFPKVTLVGVVLADSGLSMPDFRASERTFQLLTQVAGRSGRADLKGQVIVQTLNPEHPAIFFSKSHDVAGFSLRELEERRLFNYPPFTRCAIVRIEALGEGDTQELAEHVREKIDVVIKQRNLQDQIAVLGPAPCPMLRIRKFFRWQVFLKCKAVQSRKALLRSLLADKDLSRHLSRKKGRLIVDVDPIQML